MKDAYHNDASPAERLAAHQNDERVRKGGTYHEFARFAAERKQRVVGSRPLVEYPALLPAEEPLGVDLSVAPVVGEPHEIAASLGEAHSNALGVLPSNVADGALPGAAQRADAVLDRPPASPARRRRSQKGTP
jgi:hypothetical protein